MRGHNWITTNYQLANIEDRLQGVQFAVSQSGGGKPQKPKPVDRPGANEAIGSVPKGQESAAAAYLASLQPAS